MRSYLLAFLFLVCAFNASAQFAALQELRGEYPQNNKKYNELRSGSPYFQDEWVKAKLLASDGVIYKDIDIKLNLLDDKIHFKDANGNEMLIKSHLSQIDFGPNSKGKSYLFINGNLLPKGREGWHQVLVNDSISLLRSFEKNFAEHKSYGSPIEYSVETKEKYFVVYNKEIFEVKKASDLADIIPSKKSQIEDVIKKTKSKSKEDQFVAVTQFMNTID